MRGRPDRLPSASEHGARSSDRPCCAPHAHAWRRRQQACLLRSRQPPSEGGDKVWRRALAQALTKGVDAPSNSTSDSSIWVSILIPAAQDARVAGLPATYLANAASQWLRPTSLPSYLSVSPKVLIYGSPTNPRSSSRRSYRVFDT